MLSREFTNNCEPIHEAHYSEPHSDALRLHNVLTHEAAFPEKHKAQRQLFSIILDRAEASAIIPGHSEAIQQIGESIDWALFAKPGDILPASLIISEDDGKKNIVSSPSSKLYYEAVHDVIDNYLIPAGFRQFYEALICDFHDRRGNIKATVREIVESQPAFQFIKSFGEPNPIAPENQPLTLSWRTIRETQIEQSIRRRFGLQYDEPIMPMTPGRIALNRELYPLNDETMRRPSDEDKADPLDKLREFFITHAVGYWRSVELKYIANSDDTSRLAEMASAGIYRHSYGLTLEGLRRDGEFFCHTISHNDMFAEKPFSGASINGFNSPKILHESIFVTALEALYDNNNNYRELHNYWRQFEFQGNFDEFLKTISDKQTDKFMRDLEPNSDLYNMVCLIGHSDLESWLKQPSDESYTCSSVKATKASNTYRPIIYIPSFEINEVSIDELPEPKESDGRVCMDKIIHFPDNITHDVRLIHYLPVTDDIKIYDNYENNQLVINTWHYGSELKIPYDRTSDKVIVPNILGYKLVGKYPYLASEDGERIWYQYVLEADNHDPYAVPHIAIPKESHQLLIKTYHDLGLTNLVKFLEKVPSLDVVGLAKSIADNNYYYTSKPDDGFPKKLSPKSINDFAAWVKNGQLHMQCDGAALFLKLSLESIFGQNSAGTVRGYALVPNQDQISTVQHAQTVFNYKGKKYMLDATPSKGGDNLIPGITSSSLRSEAIIKPMEDTGVSGIIEAEPSIASLTKNSDIHKHKTDKFVLTQNGNNINVLFSPEKLHINTMRDHNRDKTNTLESENQAKSDQEESNNQIKNSEALLKKSDQDEIKRKEREKKLQHIREKLEAGLLIICDLPNTDNLYKKIAKLKHHDPVKRGLEAVIRAQNSKIDKDSLVELSQYLNNIQRADRKMIQLMRLKPYSPELMVLLRQSIQELIAAFG